MVYSNGQSQGQIPSASGLPPVITSPEETPPSETAAEPGHVTPQETPMNDMTAIRAAFGIAPELYKDFAQLRRKVLEKAKAEIDHLAHFTVDWREIRRGRTIVEIVDCDTSPEQASSARRGKRDTQAADWPTT